MERVVRWLSCRRKAHTMETNKCRALTAPLLRDEPVDEDDDEAAALVDAFDCSGSSLDSSAAAAVAAVVKGL